MSLSQQLVVKPLKRFAKKTGLGYLMHETLWAVRNGLDPRVRELKKSAGIPSEEPSLLRPTSQLATARQCLEPVYLEWCKKMRSPARFSRKQWEFVFILETLRHFDAIGPSRRGLGFGCGREPLPAILVAQGCQITATDLDLERAQNQGWADTYQHSANLEALNEMGLCPPERFKDHAEFRVVDMNHIPEDLRNYDFTWSSCAFEHLGSLRHGMEFVKNSIKCLRPGGIAVHTTEFNLSSNDETIESPGLSIYRRRDIEALAAELREAGHEVLPLNFHQGSSRVDDYVDLPPYRASPHMKLEIERFRCTSVGIVVRSGSGRRQLG